MQESRMRSVFKWPMQLARHGKKCLKASSVQEQKNYFSRDG